MIPFKSVYDKLNIFRDRLSETVEDLGDSWYLNPFQLFSEADLQAHSIKWLA